MGGSFAGSQTVAFAAAVSLAVAATPWHAEARDPADVLRVRAELQVADGWGEQAHGRLADQLDARLRKAGFLPGSTRADAELRVIVRMHDAQTGEAAFDVAASLGNEPLACSVVDQRCLGCSPGDLQARVLEPIDACVQELTLAVETGADAPAPTRPSAMQPQPPEPTDGRAPGVMGWSGIGVLSVGLGLAIGGAVMTATGKRELTEPGGTATGVDDPMLRNRQVQNLRPAGIALLATSALALITGGILLGLDRRKGKRGSAALYLDGASAGLVWRSTF